ncbi:Polysaccharide biosynthesis protein [Planctomycetes bacterium Poly30]|uniref:Polysaccharide biosynthesis protein n=1 Tax=Saltatorellus ferox TaxID=2528018 RepID=A0A518ESV6_9BACT|nr:Polysaccharide biosynthesis protein [Planctomycetes bacterium Poly30]
MISLLRRTLGSGFFRQSTTLQGAAFVNAASNLAGTIALTNILGVGELAIFYLAVSAYSLLWSFMNLGLASVATSRIAANLQAGRKQRMIGWVGILLRLSLALSVVAFLVGGLVLPPACEAYFEENQIRIGELSVLLMLIPLLDVPRIAACSALQAERRMLALARVDIGQELCRLVLVLAGALAFGNAMGPVVGMLAASAAGSAIALDTFRRERKEPSSSLPRMGTAIRARSVPARLALREGIKVGLVRNIDSLGMTILPTLILGGVGDQKWVTYLRIAQRMITMARLFMQGINRTALPALSQLAGVKDLVGLRRLYWRASFYSGGAVTLGLLVFLPLLPYVIGLFEESYAEPVWLLSLILAPGLAIVSFSVANDVFYLVTGQMRVAIVISMVGLFVNTTVITVLAHQFPRVGVAMGLTFTCLFSLVHVGYAWLWFRRNDHLFLRETPDGDVMAGTAEEVAGGRSAT